MFNKKLFIINNLEFYKIILELKDYIDFKINHFDNWENFHKFLGDNFDNQGNFLILFSSKPPRKFEMISKNAFYELIFPIKIFKLLENINIKIIQQKYSLQSSISIKDYSLNLNSKILKKDSSNLKLTEREIDIILFLNQKKTPIKIDILEKEIWNYSSDLETHTVETHVYRLRKKIKDSFNDENFILSDKEGYLIR